jgi:hypothetical protein
MNEKLKQCILETLRMGEDPDKLCNDFEMAFQYLKNIKTYNPNHDMADFYRAYKDADFRP